MAGTLVIDTLKASSGVLATQNGMTGIAKAWCNFNGTSGATAINTGFNFSSITRNGVGDYSFSFTTAMPISTYSVVFGGDTANNSRGVTIFIHDGATAMTTSGFRIQCSVTAVNTFADITQGCIAVFSS